MEKIYLTQKELVQTLLYLHKWGSKGLTLEEISNALNLNSDSIRSIISILRNQHMEEIIDTTFENPTTGFRKKRYRYAKNMGELKEWRLKNRDRSEGYKLGRPMY
jgi:DNA-binding transcriptional MerR regulator|tara:strand:+ start:1822 stop:2136 length:315 start_codon:yes stop_codon:yes gene_type:complete